jgi:hypothetical protein
LSASANPVAHLASVSFTASVTPLAAAGTVLFRASGTAFDAQTLSGGTATSVATATLPRGTNLIAAEYSGNSNYLPGSNVLNLVVTNNPPTVKPATFYRFAGHALQIALADLSTNWSDLDGDTVTLASVATSTNGTTPTYDSNYVYCGNTDDAADQFSYTVSDGQGGTASNVVNVLVAVLKATGATVNVDRSVTLGFAGIPGDSYWIEAATNLNGPVDWLPISTNAADTNGLWQSIDAQATNYLQRFYRAHRP